MKVIEGQIVTLKHYTGREFSQGIIMTLLPDSFIVKPVKESAVFSYFTNDPLVLGLFDSNEPTMCECTILSINYNDNYVELRIDNEYKIAEKRSGERFPASIYGVIVRSEVKGAVYVKNISLSGLAIKTKADFSNGHEIEIEAYVNKILLSVKTESVWKAESNDDFEYGLRILNQNEQAKKIITEYIDSIRDMQNEAIQVLKKVSRRE